MNLKAAKLSEKIQEETIVLAEKAPKEVFDKLV
jgi:hypothetical protein